MCPRRSPRSKSATGGQRKCQSRPENDWIRTEVPHLRIVTDQEWDAAHRRRQSTAAVYLRSTNGHQWGRPRSGIDSPPTGYSAGSSSRKVWQRYTVL